MADRALNYEARKAKKHEEMDTKALEGQPPVVALRYPGRHRGLPLQSVMLTSRQAFKLVPLLAVQQLFSL